MSTRIDNLSTTGASIGAAEASSTHVKLAVAAAPASAALPVRKSRRRKLQVIAPSMPCSIGHGCRGQQKQINQMSECEPADGTSAAAQNEGLRHAPLGSSTFTLHQ